jgi:ABC-type methionine transport system ATPase subunit
VDEPTRCFFRFLSLSVKVQQNSLPSMPKDLSRLWLMFPAKLITRPIIYELGQKFPVITNVRQASVNSEVGLVSLELEGERADIKTAIAWLEELGVKVEPVEINIIEG